MFYRTAEYYDAIYSWKDYDEEARRLRALIAERCRSDGRRLLDVACGTGEHLRRLRADFDVEGLDHDPRMIDIARGKLPGIAFHCASMDDFDLGSHFDVVTCLFSSIGYMKTESDLERALRCLARHVAPGGLLLLEPWFTPDEYRPGKPHMVTVDQPDLKICRMNSSGCEGRISIMEMHHLVGTPRGVEHVVELHELRMSTREELQVAIGAVGLEPHFDATGPMGRGLHIGVRPRP
ncbi:MAG: trans-aconitate 2-methyltransferase [Planctomycetota bacterium]